ncbi:MAG: IMP dehydrogenase [Chloroflexota bacterium]|nr:IMP dehydrogenase [Chloroflexota bacterium]
MNLHHDNDALTFDDVLLVPCASDVHPQEVDIKTRLTRRITLNVPLLSAAMDTVTEGNMAIAVARQGGLGVVHRNLKIDEQAAEVDIVKRSESGMITRPITLTPDRPIGDAKELMSHYRISGVPITDERGRLVGILTNRDLLFEGDTDRPCGAVMTKDNLITAPLGTTLAEAERLLHRHKIEKLPIVDGDGRLTGLITVKDISKRRAYPNAAKDAGGRLLVGAGLGTVDTAERAAALVEAGVDVLVLDTAHGHARDVVRTAAMLKERFPDTDLIAGNVVTAEGTRDLIAAGVDAVKVGVGAGSICTTRVVTGVGMPQITAIDECARVAAEYDIPIIADGGVKYSGDVVKALAAGASAVMLGSMLAGTDESPGEVILYNGERFKEYRGMGSIGAMRTRTSTDRYRQERVTEVSKLVPEGIEGRISYKGPVGAVIYQIVGGLRAGMGYTGARDLADLRTKPMVRITNAGLFESHPHSVSVTKEAPNYQRHDG